MIIHGRDGKEAEGGSDKGGEQATACARAKAANASGVDGGGGKSEGGGNMLGIVSGAGEREESMAAAIALNVGECAGRQWRGTRWALPGANTTRGLAKVGGDGVTCRKRRGADSEQALTRERGLDEVGAHGRGVDRVAHEGQC